MPPRILIVDDEARLAEVLALGLQARGFEAVSEGSAQGALERLRQESFDLVVTDLRMPHQDGRALLHELRAERPELPVVIMTAYASLRDAVQLAKEGAFDYIEKPFELDDMLATISRALRLGDALAENQRLRREIEGRFSFGNLVGRSERFKAVISQIAEVCASRATVLLLGESGTGKEMLARAIHFNSPRKSRRFVAVNCAAIPEGLLESELFGHAKGAFTGAVAAREGRFSLADGGTLLLDEIGDMPLSIQAKVLRVLQEQAFERLGGTRTIRVDVRVIAATNRDLEAMVARGDFRDDLYYRLNVVSVEIPPLRERREDIPGLVQLFLRRFAGEAQAPVKTVSREAMDVLVKYHYPGNVRELENIVHRAVVLARDVTIGTADLPIRVTEGPAAGRSSDAPAFVDRVAEFERALIVEALERAGGVQTHAARALGMSERHLRYKLHKYKLNAGGAADGPEPA